MIRIVHVAAPILALTATACTTTQPVMIAPVEQPLALRRLQSHRFDTLDEVQLLETCADVLVDLGFQIDASDEVLGLLVASKQRSAVETGQILISFAAAALTGFLTPYDTQQTLRVSITSDPGEDACSLRANFQRVVWNSYGVLSRAEPLGDREIYRTFFDRVDEAMMQDGES
ncbi:MAG: hypothetical protein GY715_05595 [Planctomycetes bacterium]|nr:hypothetical protein [Planctomycetota bacterium]